MDPVESFEYKKHKVKIFYDDDLESPREWDNLGTMVCFHSRYNLGDKHDYREPDEFIMDLASQYFNEDTVDRDLGEFDTKAFIEKYLEKLNRHIFILPLYLYDHSGLTISTSPFSCPWDSGQVGWIYVEKAKIREEWKKKRISPKLKQQTLNNLEGEVETYDQYLRGDVFGFVITHNEEEINSCWGFYGDPEDYMIPETKTIIDSYITATG